MRKLSETGQHLQVLQLPPMRQQLRFHPVDGAFAARMCTSAARAIEACLHSTADFRLLTHNVTLTPQQNHWQMAMSRSWACTAENLSTCTQLQRGSPAAQPQSAHHGLETTTQTCKYDENNLQLQHRSDSHLHMPQRTDKGLHFRRLRAGERIKVHHFAMGLLLHVLAVSAHDRHEELEENSTNAYDRFTSREGIQYRIHGSGKLVPVLSGKRLQKRVLKRCGFTCSKY
jgi:hypothetical protein